MSTKKLSKEELKETNGGGLLGGDSSSSSLLDAGLNIDNLASFSNSSTDGDESQSSSTSIGNGINFGTKKGSSNSQS